MKRTPTKKGRRLPPELEPPLERGGRELGRRVAMTSVLMGDQGGGCSGDEAGLGCVGPLWMF